MFEIFLKHINYMASPTSPHPGFGFLCFRSKADQKSLCHAFKKKKKKFRVQSVYNEAVQDM